MIRHSAVGSLVLALCGAVWATDEIRMTTAQMQQLGVRTAVVEASATMPVAVVPARVTVPPEQDFVISTPQAGLIRKLYVAVGHPVQVGQKLAEVASPTLIALQQQLLSAHNQRNLAAAQFRRADMLFKEGIVAQREWLERKAELDAQTILLDAQHQLLRLSGQSQTDIDRVLRTHKLVGHLAIAAPVAGVVTEQLAVSGQRVDAQSPLYRVAKLDKLWLEIDLPQEHLRQIALGDAVRGPQVEATITLIGQSVDAMSQTVMLRAEIVGRPQHVLPNQKFRVELLHRSAIQLLRVPAAAVVRSGDQDYLFVRSTEGFTATPIQVASTTSDYALIRATDLASAEVAVQGVATLKAKWLGVGAEGGE